MHVDKYKQEDGRYLYTDECTYDNAEDLLGSMLGFCGCGCNRDAMEFVLACLDIIDFQTKTPLRDARGRWDEYLSITNKLWNDLIPSEQQRWFVWYMLDRQNLTEHGTSITHGGWLTDKGREMLDDLRELLIPAPAPVASSVPPAPESSRPPAPPARQGSDPADGPTAAG